MNWLIFVSIVAYGSWFLYQRERKKIQSRNPEIFSKSYSDLDEWEIGFIHRYKETNKSNARFFSGITAAAVLLAVWNVYWIPHQESLGREQFKSDFLNGFNIGWEYECSHIFENLGPQLYAGNYVYTEDWCNALNSEQAALDTYSLRFGTDSGDNGSGYGEGAGVQAAIKEVFSKVPYLCFGEECVTEESEMEYLEQMAQDEFESQDPRN
jgi:hypothetical protein